jgi:hypothetical protein
MTTSKLRSPYSGFLVGVAVPRWARALFALGFIVVLLDGVVWFS